MGVIAEKLCGLCFGNIHCAGNGFFIKSRVMVADFYVTNTSINSIRFQEYIDIRVSDNNYVKIQEYYE